jgi:hypothetical protein
VALEFFIMGLIIAATCRPPRRPRAVPRKSYDAEMESALAIGVNPRLTAGGKIDAMLSLRCGTRQALSARRE